MKLLSTIADGTLNPHVHKREAVRAIVFDQDDLMPLLYVSQHSYHKLPGGGVEFNESPRDALEREILEETGCTIAVEATLGQIEEYRSEYNLHQVSTCFIGKVLITAVPAFQPIEVARGFTLIWVTLNEAITLVKNDASLQYEGKFIRQRDLAFLMEAKKYMSKSLVSL